MNFFVTITELCLMYNSKQTLFYTMKKDFCHLIAIHGLNRLGSRFSDKILTKVNITLLVVTNEKPNQVTEQKIWIGGLKHLKHILSPTRPRFSELSNSIFFVVVHLPIIYQKDFFLSKYLNILNIYKSLCQSLCKSRCKLKYRSPGPAVPQDR